MAKFGVHKLKEGERVSLFVQGFPKWVILSNDTSQKVLSFLYDHGVKGIIKLKDVDNKG